MEFGERLARAKRKVVMPMTTLLDKMHIIYLYADSETEWN